MRVILDENVPRAVARWLVKHEATTVQDAGFRGLDNGRLLLVLEGEYDVLITADKNLRYQRSLSGRRLGIVELPTNRLPALRRIRARILAAVNRCGPSDYIEVEV